MFINKATGTPPNPLPPTEQDQSAAAPAALGPSLAGAASAAAVADIARSAALQTPSPTVPRIPLHRLGGENATAGTLAAAPSAEGISAPAAGSAAAAAARPQYPTEPAGDRMGIVGEYLAQPDQLVLRDMSDAVRDVVDLSLNTLTVSAQDACALLAQPDTLATRKALHLVNCNDADLISVAEALRALPRPTISITLDKENGVWVSAAGLRAFAGLTLAGLHVKGLMVAPDAAEALATILSPVSISLHPFADGVTNIYWLTQIERLTSLDVGKHHVSRASIAAFASHPNLKALQVSTLPATAIRQILTSQTLRSFAVNDITGDAGEAFEAFADNKVLTSLSVGIITRAESLVTLSRNTTLTSVDLTVNRAASAAIPYLANLPALASLYIKGFNVTLTHADVQAVCARPLASLGVDLAFIDPAAMDLIVKSQAASLSLTYVSSLTDATVDALVENERVSELNVTGYVVDERRALRLIASSTLEKLTVDFDSDVPDISDDYFKRTWIAAGKSLDNLQLTVLPKEDEPDVP